jgi:catechol 2,3-dioxygenase-like lactoylglutathione lyase family enzyme
MFHLDQIDHVALTVQDVPRSIAWYRDVLGLERRHEEAWGDHPAVLYAGSTAVALFPAERTLGPAPDRRGTPTMRHLAFRVDRVNFTRAQADLAGRHIPFSAEDHGISRSIYFQDPDGHELEITTYDLDLGS